MKVVLQGMKELVERAGHTYNPKHEAMLPEPMVNGRLHTLPNHGPRMASPAAAVKTFPPLPPKKSVKMSPYKTTMGDIPMARAKSQGIDLHTLVWRKREMARTTFLGRIVTDRDIITATKRYDQ